MPTLNEHEYKIISTTEEERLRRLSFCDSCEHNKTLDQPICTQCACPITFVTQFEFKLCPIGKWQ